MPKGFWAPGGAFVVSGQLVMQPPKPYPQFVETFGMEEIQRAMQWFEGLGIELGQAVNVEGVSGGTVMPVKPVEALGMWGLMKPGAEFDASNYGGAQASLLMEETMLKNGARILYETRAVELLTDDTGRVTGVRAEDADGPFTINAQATILCTGGFGLNEEMVSRYTLSPAREVVNATLTSPGATGDGLRMALEIGAGASGFGLVYARISPAAAAKTMFHDLNGTRISSLRAGMAVDTMGRRMADESLGTLHMGTVMLKELGVHYGFFVVGNEQAADLEAQIQELRDLGEEYGETLIYEADTLEELAEVAGLGPHFLRTVEEFNQAVDEGTTQLLPVPRTEPVTKIATPPFYAAPFVMGVNKSYGGVDMDVSGRVLDVQGQPIPGLYAAGEVTYASRVAGVPQIERDPIALAGNGGSGNLDNCLLFGLHAAETAAEEVGAKAE
jgi:succinate dehydrogenase/fumarate reductase flavoprotein subunit